MAKIELSDDERRSLVQLIDIAVKAGGLGVAEPATLLFAKIRDVEPQLEAVESPEEGEDS
tara:strand:+ start:560 stop:739 length:180 start_codon:yes stop_codon:yes gene_type:complete